MAVMGRILQGVGWLWIVAGVVGQFVGYEQLSWVPGVVLLFVARLLRTQARRTAPPEPVEPLAREPIASAPRPKPIDPPPPTPKRPAPRPPSAEPAPPPPPPPAEPGPSTPVESPAPPLEPAYKPMSSDEMIAAARKRWDRPRN